MMFCLKHLEFHLLHLLGNSVDCVRITRAVATRFLVVRLDNGRWYLQLTIYMHAQVARELYYISRRV